MLVNAMMVLVEVGTEGQHGADTTDMGLFVDNKPWAHEEKKMQNGALWSACFWK
jgi:hypothetical protein